MLGERIPDHDVFITSDPEPKDLRFVNDIFYPGRTGASNLPLVKNPQTEILRGNTAR